MRSDYLNNEEMYKLNKSPVIINLINTRSFNSTEKKREFIDKQAREQRAHFTVVTETWLNTRFKPSAQDTF